MPVKKKRKNTQEQGRNKRVVAIARGAVLDEAGGKGDRRGGGGEAS